MFHFTISDYAHGVCKNDGRIEYCYFVHGEKLLELHELLLCRWMRLFEDEIFFLRVFPQMMANPTAWSVLDASVYTFWWFEYLLHSCWSREFPLNKHRNCSYLIHRWQDILSLHVTFLSRIHITLEIFSPLLCKTKEREREREREKERNEGGKEKKKKKFGKTDKVREKSQEDRD